MHQGALAQTAPPARTPAENHSLSQDVVRPYGDYHYMPQKGLYKDVTFGDVADDFKEALSRSAVSVANLNNYLGWHTAGSSGGLSWNFGAGVGGLAFPGFGASFGSEYTAAEAGYLQIAAGPLLLDNFYAGYGAIYSDINGAYPGLEALPPDDRWAHIVWLSFRSTLALGDTIGLSIQPFIYWLPATGKVGWGLPGPFFGLVTPQLGSLSLFQLVYLKEIGNWRFSAYDQFSPLLSFYNIWDMFANYNMGIWGDLSPIDRVGRYSLGYGAADTTNYDPQARFNFGETDWTGMMGYYNIAGARATGTHGYHTQSLFYLNRVDYWDKDFRGVISTIGGGAYLRTGEPDFNVYGGYDFISAEPYDSFLNSVVVGVNKRVSHSIRTYAQGGYYWYSGEGDKESGALAQVGFQHSITPRIWHGANAGRRVFKPANALPGIEDFAEYVFGAQLGMRTSLTFNAGISDRRIRTTGPESDYVIKYAGALLSSHLTTRLNSFASSGWENVEIEATGLELDRWTHRLGLMYTLTRDIQSQAFYQYEDVHGSLNYSEHYLYLGISKRF